MSYSPPTRPTTKEFEALPLKERLFRTTWWEKVFRGPNGTPLLNPEFVAEQGKKVRIIDVRPREEFCGPLGHIPGAIHLSLERVPEVMQRLGKSTPVVLVSNRTDRAGKAAQFLELLGMDHVAALEGGMAAWKSLGFMTLRDPAGFDRPLEPLHEDQVEPTGPLTEARLQAHVGDPGSVRWVKLAAFLLHGKRSCVDGRDDQGVIGSPGGDCGELVLVLGALEAATGIVLDRATIRGLLGAYVDTFGRFYLHNDLHTVGKLIPRVRADPRIGPHVEHIESGLAWRTFLMQPPAALHEALLEHYTQPDAVGCGHLRLMAKDPAKWGVRQGLVEDVLHAYWTHRWAGHTELEYVVLGGDHAERGVVLVTVEESLWAFTRVPLLSPAIGPNQVFVHHPQVAHYLREQLVDFLLRQHELLPVVPYQRKSFAQSVHALGEKQLTATLGVLAQGLPLFEVSFAGPEKVTVKAR